MVVKNYVLTFNKRISFLHGRPERSVVCQCTQSVLAVTMMIFNNDNDRFDKTMISLFHKLNKIN